MNPYSGKEFILKSQNGFEQSPTNLPPRGEQVMPSPEESQFGRQDPVGQPWRGQDDVGGEDKEERRGNCKSQQ